MKFTFAPESRPLEGFTIKRAIYRGGFGEVYYALSDAGREVALKLLQNNADVELRGIQQCLNLSHPNLVTIFDVRQDGEGDHWIIMEYVSGDTLDQVIRKHPEGMPLETVRKWLPGIVAGVAYLHSRGIVHRDLKPANVFSEDGVVKIGDVGLSKFITPSRRSAQTQSVGTVYYMAPEVAKGKYGREVDVYALGVILYEMLTGQVPFDGESTGEILMKHLSEPPDLGQLPPRLRGVIGKALHKDPEKRFRSMDQFRRAFEDALLGRVEPIEIPEESFAGGPQRPLEETQRYEPNSAAPGARASQSGRESFFARNSTVLWGVLGGLLITLLIARGRPGTPELILGAGAGAAVAAVLVGRREFGQRGRDRHHAQQSSASSPPNPEGRDVPHGAAASTNREEHPHHKFEPASRSTPPPRPGNAHMQPLEITSQAWGWLIALAVVAAATLIPATILGVGVGMAVLVLGGFTVAVIVGLVVKWQDFLHWHASWDVTPGPSRQMPNAARSRRPTRPGLSQLFGGAFLTVPLTALLTGGMAIIKPSLFTLSGAGQLDPAAVGMFSIVTVAASWAALATPYLAVPFGRRWMESRLCFAATGAVVGLLAFFLNNYLLVALPITGVHAPEAMFAHVGELPLIDKASGPTWAGFATFFAALFGLRQWSGMVDPRRRARFSIGSVLLTLLVAWLTTKVFAFPTTWAVAWAAVIACVVQLASPWDPTRTGTKAWK
jgi:serine/threonine protein kinase